MRPNLLTLVLLVLSVGCSDPVVARPSDSGRLDSSTGTTDRGNNVVEDRFVASQDRATADGPVNLIDTSVPVQDVRVQDVRRDVSARTDVLSTECVLDESEECSGLPGSCCASGRTCMFSGTLPNRVCCSRANSGSCTSDNGCCGIAVCRSNRCCFAAGETAAAAAECCPGLTFTGGRCTTPTVACALLEGMDCAPGSASACCAEGRTCGNVTTPPVPRDACCRNPGGACSSDDGCCDQGDCNGGTCCFPENVPATSSSQCCPGLSLQGGVCRSDTSVCAEEGEECSGRTCCAGLLCDGTCFLIDG